MLFRSINHLYIARLAKEGNFPLIVTSSFDRFLEKAFSYAQIEYETCIAQEDFRRFEVPEPTPRWRLSKKGSCVHLLKIHGSVEFPETIYSVVDGSGKRALGTPKKEVLSRLLTRYPFVFLGYSGREMRNDPDYLGMLGAREQAKGFVWVIPPESKNEVAQGFQKIGRAHV